MSPAKTWEGFVAGFAASVLVSFFALYQDRERFLEIWEALLLGAVIALAGTVGDLFESAVKRDMQVKDTGRILGRHGGVLDRVDSLLFATVAAFYTIVALT
jgi:phosphatidate cytidylyltransferase